MNAAATSQPSASPGLVPYISVRDAAAAIEFYEKAFGAEEDFRLTEPSGKIGHAEIDIAGSRLMLADEYPDFGSVSPSTLGGSPVLMQLTVDDVDAAAKRAVDAGGTLQRGPSDEFHGHRQAMIADPFGYSWFLSKQIEQVSPAEMQRRFNESFSE